MGSLESNEIPGMRGLWKDKEGAVLIRTRKAFFANALLPKKGALERGVRAVFIADLIRPKIGELTSNYELHKFLPRNTDFLFQTIRIDHGRLDFEDKISMHITGYISKPKRFGLK